MRKAIAQAIDKKTLYQTVFPGYPVPDLTPCQGAVPGQTYWALPADQATCPGFDVNAANQALDQAGYTKGSDGIRVDPKTKQPLVFEHCTSNISVRTTSADFMAKSLQAIGIKLNVTAVDSTHVFFATWGDVDPSTKCAIFRGNYDTAEYAYVLSFDLFGNVYYSYHRDQIPTDANKGNGYNSLFLNDTDVNAAIDKMRVSINPQDQLQYSFQVQKIIDVDKTYEIVLYYRTSVRGQSTRLQNFLPNPSNASDDWNAQDWFVTGS